MVNVEESSRLYEAFDMLAQEEVWDFRGGISRHISALRV